MLADKSWQKMFNTLIQTIFIFKLCRNRQNENQAFTVVFENLNIELLSMLLIFLQSYPFFKLKRAEKYKIDNNLETYSQLNLVGNKAKLNSSTLCLLVSNNPRYEGYYLNLNLRQRFFKGNFKCLIIGSLINLTFPVSFLGSQLDVFKTIVEGNNITCQELKFSKNPLLVFNQELLKKNEGTNVLKMSKYINIFTNTWKGLNVLNTSLHDGGINYLNKFLPVSAKDLSNSNLLYFLNVSTSRISNLKKIVNLKLLNYTKNKVNSKQIILNQNYKENSNSMFYNDIFLFNKEFKKNYLFIPSSSFYENNETYVNTEGHTKRVTKLVFKKKTRNNWQILRQILKQVNRKI